MSWIRKQIEGLLRESARRHRLVRGGVVAAVAVALVVTAALVRGVTAAGPGDVPGETVASLGTVLGNGDTQTSDGQAQVPDEEASPSGEEASDEGEADEDSPKEATDTSNDEGVDTSGADALSVSALNAVTTNDVTTNEVTATNSDGNPSKGTLTNAEFQVNATGGGTTTVTGDQTVAAGTRVQFALTFEFSAGTLSSDGNTVTYTLPDGIDVSTSDGSEKDITGATGTAQAGKKLGTFKIENGVVTMTFSNEEEKDLYNEQVTATLTFWGTAENSSLTTQKDYDFEGVGTLHVDPTTPTLQVSKGVTKQKDTSESGRNADLADGEGNRDRHADYTITVSTTTGTAGTVTIDDSMATNTNVSTISYDSNTFTLKKYSSASDTTGTTVSYESSQLSVTTGQNAGFTLSGLDALKAGERYELTYSATVTETDHTANSSATNNVTVRDDGSTASSTGTATASWSNVGDINLTKSGQVLDDVVDESNPKKRRIKYTLLVWSNSGSVTNIQIGDGANDTGSTNIDTSAWNSTDSKNLFFEHDSFHITKYASKADAESGTNGTDADSLRTNLSFGADGIKPSLSLQIAEPLEAGEAYVLTYTAVVDEIDHNAPDTVMNNQAVARIYPGGTEKKTGQQNARVTWHNEIQKTGTFNQTTGNIDWVVTVNRNGGDARGTVMEDTLQQALSSSVRIYQGNTLVKTLDLQSGDHSVATEGYDGDPSTYNTTSGLLHVVLGSWATSTGAYTIRFSTKAPADGTVSNSAAYIKNGTTYGSQGISVGVSRTTEWGLAKAVGTNSGSYDTESGVYRMSWNANVTFPDEDLTPSGSDGVLKLHDTFGQVTNEDGTTNSNYTGAHYAVAKDLYAELTGKSAETTVTLSLHGDTDADGNAKGAYTLTNGVFVRGTGDDQETLSGVTVVLTFYDADGNVIENPSTSDARVYGFDMVLTRIDGGTINGQVLTVTGYHTVVDGSSLPASTTLNVGNSLSSNHTSGSSPSAGSITTLSNPLEKAVRTLDDRSDNSDSEFAGRKKFEADWQGTASGDYDSMSGKQHAAQFRIALNTVDYPDNATVTITDTLPTGMVLATSTNNGLDDVAHPIRLVYGTNIGRPNASYTATDTLRGSTTSGTYLSYATSTVNGQQVVTFTFSLTDSLPKGQYYITYTASFLDDSAWQLAATSQRSYTNTASATIGGKDYTVSSTLNVTREVSPVTKKAYGTTTNDRKASYKIVINPAAEDLNPGSDTVDLTDSLGTFNTAQMNPELDLTSIHLYRYSDTATDNLGAELDTSRYSVQYEHDGGTRRMTVTVPDSTALVLTYTYEYKPGTGGDWGTQVSGSTDYEATVGNTASIGGSSQSAASQSIRRSSAGGSAYTRALYLYKVDKDNYAKTLTGASFSLWRWDADSNAWISVANDIRGGTSSQGTYTPGQVPLDTNGLSQTNTLYMLRESVAPEGYGRTVKYVVVLNNNTTEDDAWTAIAGSSSGTASITKTDADGNAVGSTISCSEVTFIPYQGGSIYVEDEATSVTVTKNWNATDGTALDADSSELPQSITLQLKRTTTGSTDWSDYGEAVTVTAADGWSHSWTDLDKSDGSGNTYIYKVEEVNATGEWKATYLNNDGITTGNITITNTRQYSLPSTGGVPLTVVWVTGGVLAVGAAIVLAVRRLSR